ncbi:hypothetical protein L2E82_10432 [Cichorium intybus]|uniref:Uncharacterized protein n=1 Tax=Cichorium intybus TaxID=13427 RepID=A0ACB9GBJ7_CICIN|nr:hypothetical protein L2E82_10432 [Cichorium intybus]
MFLSNKKTEPAHYLLKIESFSVLSEAGTIKFESEVFEASGRKWRLDLHPNGNVVEGVDDHISLYLRISDTGSLSKGWKVDVDVNFFIYNHIGLRYVSFENDDGNMTTDSCVFGVEIAAVPKYALKDRCLSMIKPPLTMNTYSWTIDKFSVVKEKILTSEVFKVGKVKWTLKLYPKGCKSGAGTNVSIFLKVHESALLPDGWKVYAKCELRVKNQRGFADKLIEMNHWFCESVVCRGYSRFMQLSELRDISNGFLLNDKLIVEAKILVIGMLRNFI